jgi:hypothetical protein
MTAPPAPANLSADYNATPLLRHRDYLTARGGSSGDPGWMDAALCADHYADAALRPDTSAGRALFVAVHRYAWPGGYALGAVTDCGDVLCPDCCASDGTAVDIRSGALHVGAILVADALETSADCSDCGERIGEDEPAEPDGYLCTDCALFVGTGECEDPDPSWSADSMRGDWSVSSHDDHRQEFSWSACDCCGSTLGGAREGAYLLPEPAATAEGAA